MISLQIEVLILKTKDANLIVLPSEEDVVGDVSVRLVPARLDDRVERGGKASAILLAAADKAAIVKTKKINRRCLL